MHLLVLASALLGVQAASIGTRGALTNAVGRILVPNDAVEGYYTVTLTDEGEWNHTRVQTFDHLPPEYWTKQAEDAKDQRANETTLEARQSPTGGYCNSPVVFGDDSEWDIAAAQYSSARLNTVSFCFDAKSDYTIYGNYVVYGCNYQTVSCQTHSGFDSDYGWVGNACRGKAGYYSHQVNAWGRTLKGIPIC